MDIFTFIKSLSRSERVGLAEEVSTSVQYLTHAASRRRIGFEMAERIYRSRVNIDRPEQIQFTAKDWNEYQVKRVLGGQDE